MPTDLMRYDRKRGRGQARTAASINTARLAVKLAKAAGREARRVYDDYTSRKAGGPSYQPTGKGPGRGKGKAPLRRAKSTNGFVGTPYAGQLLAAGKNEIVDLKKPLKGNFKPRGTLVVNKCPKVQKSKQKRDFPKSVYQTYYLGDVNLDAHGNIGHVNRRYTNMSVNTKTSTGFLMNLGTNCLLWDPTKDWGKIGNFELPAAGDATVDNPNPFWKINGTNTALEQDPIMAKQTKLPETATPYQQGALPAVLKYTVPNHVIGAVNLNLSFTSASVCDQYVSVSLLRNISAEATPPGMWSNTGPNGGIPGADTIKILCNDIRNVTGRQYETLFRTTRYIKGINLADKDPKVYYVKKNIKCNYHRSTCRRVTSALDNNVLGGQWAPSYIISQDGSMYNNLVLRVMCKCIDNGKIVSNYKGAHSSAGTVDYYNIPQLIDQDSPPSYWANANVMKSRIRFGGNVSIKCYVREYNRGLGGDVATTVTDLQNQIDELTSQVGTLTSSVAEAHNEIDDHLADECPHSDADECDTDPEESYTHTHGGDTELHVYGHAREHSHPETTSHSHDDAVVE